MGGEVEVVVRRALSEDLPRRAELLRLAYPAPLWDAFLYFFFQELTLECCVLGAAVLFIFCGVSALGAACVVPAAGLTVWVSVAVASYALAIEQAQKIRGEVVGLVAEARGALFAGPPPRIRVRIAPHSESAPSSPYSQIVGTVSVAALRGMHAAGWLHALAVHPQWRRRGVGRALEAAARRAARGAGRGALQAAVSELQPGARALLHAAGWEMRGAYARPLCGAALALPVARLALGPHSALDLA